MRVEYLSADAGIEGAEFGAGGAAGDCSVHDAISSITPIDKMRYVISDPLTLELSRTAKRCRLERTVSCHPSRSSFRCAYAHRMQPRYVWPIQGKIAKEK